MEKRERVLTALDGRRVDRLPFTVWRHHYFQDRTAEGLAEATVRFYQRHHLDMILFTPGPFYMAEAWGMDIRAFGNDDIPHYIVSPIVERAPDWRHLPEIDLETCSLQREIQAVRQVRQQLGQDDVPLIVQLLSPLTTADMLCNGRIVEDLRSFSNDLRSGLQVIATLTRDFALACLDAGADGFFFISRFASRDKMRTREYRDFGQRFDAEVLEPLADNAAIRLLCLEGENLFFDLADRYPVQAVCWETWRADLSMAAASRQVRCGLMGGLNPMVFAGGSAQDVRGEIAEAVSQTGGWHLLIAPSGPLPPGYDPTLVDAVYQAVQEA